MQTPMTRTDKLAVRIGELVTSRPILVVVGLIVLTFTLASGARWLEFSNNYRVFFGADNPELITFEKFQKTYTKNDNILFVLQPKNGEVFSPEIADAMAWLTEKSWQIPYSTRVDSLNNFQHTFAEKDDLIVRDLILEEQSSVQSELDKQKLIALAEPLLKNRLISPSATTAGVNVTLQYPEQSLDEVPQAVGFARDLADELRAKHPELTIALTGISMMNNSFGESAQVDAATLIPLMFVFMVVMMLFTLRSVTGTFSTVLVIGFSSITALGIAGLLGIKLTPVSATAPTIILTLAVADSIHFLISMLSSMREGMNKRNAIIESMRINFLPISITSITTIVGFLCLNFSDSPPFWDFGNITAMGIAAAWVYSLFFLPSILTLLPMRERKESSAHKKASRWSFLKLADFVILYRKPILVVTLLAGVGLTSAISQLELNDQFVKYFDNRVSFRTDTDFASKHLTGSYVAEFSIASKGPEGISAPEYLRNLEKFAIWLRSQPEVRHVYSYTDIIKRLNKNMHEDDPAYYRLPDSKQLAAQYHLLYELSLPYGLDMNDRVNIDKSATRISATLDDVTTVVMREFVDRSEAWLKANAPSYMVAKPTGANVMFSYISQRNIESMLSGNLVAIIAIALIMILALRSFGLGLLSLIPNVVPILMTFGLWSLLVGQVGMAAATVSASSLGIIVDDSVHFLTKYLRARREKGLERPDAIRYAFNTVGRAITVTTIILVMGFTILAASSFLVNSQLGLLTAIAIIMALIVDFFMLPALLLIGYKEDKKEVQLDEVYVSPDSRKAYFR